MLLRRTGTQIFFRGAGALAVRGGGSVGDERSVVGS